MGPSKFADGAGEREASWTNETLPLTVRRELLARELEKLGFGPAVAGGEPAGVPQQQQSEIPGRPPRDAGAAPRGE